MNEGGQAGGGDRGRAGETVGARLRGAVDANPAGVAFIPRAVGATGAVSRDGGLSGQAVEDGVAGEGPFGRLSRVSW